MNYIAKTRILIVTVVILSVLLISLLVTMGYRYYTMRRANFEMQNQPLNDRQPGEPLSRALKLSPEQEEDFAVIRKNFHLKFDSLDFEIRNVSKAIMDELSVDNPDKNKLEELIQKYGELQIAQKQVMVNHLLDVKSMCNPEQQQRFCRMVRRMNEFQQRPLRNRERMRRGQFQGPVNRNN